MRAILVHEILMRSGLLGETTRHDTQRTAPACHSTMAAMVACPVRVSVTPLSRGDPVRCRAVQWQANVPRAAARPNRPEPSGRVNRRDVPSFGTQHDRLHGVTREMFSAKHSWRIPSPNAVVESRPQLASFDDHDENEDERQALEHLMQQSDGNRDEVDSKNQNCSDASLPDEETETDEHPGVTSTSTQSDHPWWVTKLNKSLTQHPAWVLLSFLLVDVGSCLALLGIVLFLKIPVDGDFALAYALSKSIRAPRLAFDAVVAGKMASMWPSLAQVRVGPIIDAGERALREIKKVVDVWRGRGDTSDVGESTSSTSSGETLCESKSQKLAREAREMTDHYGLAYMAAKNVIGPVSIAVIYSALKYGVDVKGAMAFFGINLAGASSAGKAAGSLALASWLSTLFFPLVVLGAGFLGPVLGGGARWVNGRGGKKEKSA